MQELDQLKEALCKQRPVDWEELPDLDLYMDQVITYMPRQQIVPGADDQLTSSMINNYIKEGLLKRTKGKKYSREHLAYLTAICMLKRVLSVKDTNLLLKREIGDGAIEAFYEKYLDVLDASVKTAAGQLPETPDAEALSDAALRFAVASYANKLACERILDLLRAETEESAPAKSGKEK